MSKYFIFLLLLLADTAFSQALTLDKVNEQARQNYPLIRQKDLIRQTREITIENIKKGFLPQFAVNGQATYQSDVTMVKIPVTGINIEPLSKDQYRIVM
jgi:outer membrane protein TolC